MYLQAPLETWWRHKMEIFSALLAIYAGNSPVPGEFPTQRPVTRSFGVYFDLSPNKRLSKQSWGWWFETPSCSLWRHRNENFPDSKVHGANMGPIWGRQNPGESHVGPMNFAIWVVITKPTAHVGAHSGVNCLCMKPCVNTEDKLTIFYIQIYREENEIRAK